MTQAIVTIYNLPQDMGDEVVDDMRLDADEAAAAKAAIRESDPMIVLTHNRRPFVIAGFIPLGPITNSAYAWMQWTPEIYEYPKSVTKACQEVFSTALTRYSYILGHCSYGDRPIRLLKHLGAKFTVDPLDGRPCYIMERSHEPT